MELRTNNIDIWVFHTKEDEPKYLLVRTSREKANRWFFGSQFWQVPGGFAESGEDVVACAVRVLGMIDLAPVRMWASEYTYTYYNARRKCLEIVPVFAAQIEEPQEIGLSWEHDSYGWFSARECLERVRFRGLKDGLQRTREHVTESVSDSTILRLL